MPQVAIDTKWLKHKQSTRLQVGGPGLNPQVRPVPVWKNVSHIGEQTKDVKSTRVGLVDLWCWCWM